MEKRFEKGATFTHAPSDASDTDDEEDDTNAWARY